MVLMCSSIIYHLVTNESLIIVNNLILQWGRSVLDWWKANRWNMSTDENQRLKYNWCVLEADRKDLLKGKLTFTQNFAFQRWQILDTHTCMHTPAYVSTQFGSTILLYDSFLCIFFAFPRCSFMVHRIASIHRHTALTTSIIFHLLQNHYKPLCL